MTAMTARLTAALAASVALLAAAPQSAPRTERVSFKSRIKLQTQKDETQEIKTQEVDVSFEMVYVPGGKFRMGSPASEAGRDKDEGPVREVEVKPFWMGKHEVTWHEFETFYNGADTLVDADSRPTFPFEPPDRGMGRQDHAAMSIQWNACMAYCRWLSKVTGKRYRLPTEAEWEYACRAGSDRPQPEPIGDHAWSIENAGKKNQRVGQKKPNAFGLHDMLGGVAEYCLEAYAEKAPANDKAAFDEGLAHVCDQFTKCSHVVRGGSWRAPAAELRAADRRPNEPKWNERDPNRPRSVWWLTDGDFVGFRLVRETEGDGK
jgi:formylglycine-generating enzyme required for sulfatase activity